MGMVKKRRKRNKVKVCPPLDTTMRCPRPELPLPQTIDLAAAVLGLTRRPEKPIYPHGGMGEWGKRTARIRATCLRC